MMKHLLAVKSIQDLKAESDKGELRRTLGPIALTAIGIGGIIGTGIFVLTGLAAAQHAGPAIVLSFIIAGIGCIFAGLCYAEFAAMVPIAGSAYTIASSGATAIATSSAAAPKATFSQNRPFSSACETWGA